MKEDGPPTKPHNKMTSPSSRSIDAADMDIYADGSTDDEFDMLTSEDERPEQLPELGGGWVDAGSPPGYSEVPSSTSNSSRREQVLSSPPPKSPMPTASSSQSEPHPLLLMPPQNHDQSNRNTSLVTQGPQNLSKPTTCVICQVRPISNDGWTCGRSCQQRLEATRQMPTGRIMEGQMSNPRYEQSTYPTSFFQNDNSSPSHQIRMCEVCHVRPKCQRGGRVYPTCGLTCAAKLSPAGTIEMCDFCKKRPKAVVNGKVYPQCGKTCRDHAKMAVTAVANSATCTTCIVCWHAPSSGESSDFCSPVCEVAANNRAPFLIELPRGHRAFRKVADVYVDDWKHTRNPIPRIKRVYMVQVKGSILENYEQYRSRVNSHAMFRKKGNEQHAWLGIVRECGFGDPGNVEPCSSAACQLCCVIRASPTNEMLTEGIKTTVSLPRAVDMTRDTRRRSSRVVLMAKVLYGKVAEWSDSLPPKLAPGYDSVNLISFTRTGTKLDLQECLVYHKHAIRPQYLITLE